MKPHFSIRYKALHGPLNRYVRDELRYFKTDKTPHFPRVPKRHIHAYGVLVFWDGALLRFVVR